MKLEEEIEHLTQMVVKMADVVLENLKIALEIYYQYDEEKIELKCRSLINDNEKEYKDKLNEVELDIKKNIETISNLYQDKLDGVVGVETYKTLSIKYENRICELNKEKEELLRKLDTLDKKIDTKKYEECKKIIEEFLSLKKPNNETIREIIDRIEISEDKKVQVYFRLKPLEIKW